MNTCLHCGNILSRKSNSYCSNKCQADLKYAQYIADWKQGDIDGNRGINAKNLSGHLIRYLRDNYGQTCSLCGWDIKNPVTGKVPLEIDHIDGNADNNVESNLQLICPNCHALTPNFRNLNKGNGRSWRTLKYLKTQS